MYISKGNLKMVKNSNIAFLIFNLPAQKTCPGCTKMCSKKCYAKKAERMYPGVLNSREQNLSDSKKDTFINDICSEIDKKLKNNKKQVYFRIHESGDFYSKEYFLKWIEVINKYPNVKFLAFTKSTFIKDYLHLIPTNLNLFYSIWIDTIKENIIESLPQAYAGIENVNAFNCTGKCAECLYCFQYKSNVKFKIH